MLSRGAKFGPYEILSPLGAGGMGEVWRARDETESRRPVQKCPCKGFRASSRDLANVAGFRLLQSYLLEQRLGSFDSCHLSG
jgi:serine/threonine protein kinase